MGYVKLFEEYVLTNLENTYDIELELWDNGDHLKLDKIVIPKKFQGTGIGSEVMQIIIDYADDNKKDIRLTPDTGFGGTSVSRLKKFYKGFGFVKNKDFEFTDSMVRYYK